MSDFFRLVNRNKRAIRLDLSDRKDGKSFCALRRAPTSSSRIPSGAMAKLGIGYDALAAVNPRLVYCSITGYGQDGPYADRAGHDITNIGYAGSATRSGRRGPCRPEFPDRRSARRGAHPVMGILAALIDAKSSGRPPRRRRHDRCRLCARDVSLLGFLENGKTPARGSGMLDGAALLQRLTGPATVAGWRWGARAKFWETLCDILGCPELKGKHIVYGAEARPVKERLAASFARARSMNGPRSSPARIAA